jgi:hypothetical protein
MQQLPSEFDTRRLQLTSSLDALMEKYVATVASLVTSDDEIMSTIEGLECLILQGLFQINAGNLRRAWLYFRRALTIAQLMGLHKVFILPTKEGDSIATLAKKEMWLRIIQADRYLALLLGLPCGTSDDFLGPEEPIQKQNMDLDLAFTQRLCLIAGRIIQRNQLETIYTSATTQEIDERLEVLKKEMPESWWDVPQNIKSERSIKVSRQFNRLMTQIWYFQLEALLHLPFMLRATTERRYEYNKFSCLKASRDVLHRYLALRQSDASAFCCRVVDFGAFTASVTLLLGLLGPPKLTDEQEAQQQRIDDRALVQTIITTMEQVSHGGRDVVATQSVNVIRTLLDADDTPGGNLRLTIPYFGTISIARGSPIQSSESTNIPISVQKPQRDMQIPQSALGQSVGQQNWLPLPFNPIPPHMPMVSFTSSQFSSLGLEPPMEDWGLQDVDTMLFDSLLNKDIEGNWIF